MPNNPISTPLPADLPVNWQTGQIVAPNGADVGLSPQHGYNYLMQQLNAAQQAANTLGAAIAALKGSDIPTSGSDSTDLATALSNKADNQSAFLDRSKTITGSVLEYALTSDPGLYLVDDISATDTPISGIWYYAKVYDVFSGHRIVELYSGAAQGHQEIYYNTYNASTLEWKGWVPVATAIQPQVYDLSLTGATGTCKYSLDQFGLVRITGLITRDDGTTYFGTLPEGYRPAAQVVFAGCGFTDGSEIFPCTAGVDPDGRVWINDFGSGFTKVPVNMYFYL